MKLKVKPMKWRQFDDIHHYSKQYYIGYFRIVDKIDVRWILADSGQEVETLVATFIENSDTYGNVPIVRNIEQAKAVCEGYILKVVNELIEVEE